MRASPVSSEMPGVPPIPVRAGFMDRRNTIRYRVPMGVSVGDVHVKVANLSRARAYHTAQPMVWCNLIKESIIRTVWIRTVTEP